MQQVEYRHLLSTAEHLGEHGELGESPSADELYAAVARRYTREVPELDQRQKGKLLSCYEAGLRRRQEAHEQSLAWD